MTSLQDRAAGALMGAFVGDALGLGPHWYYDVDEMRAAHGDWITEYTTPKPGRYHFGLKAGQLSQSGIILEMTLRSLVEQGRYDELDFCRRMDEEFFPQLNGEAAFGPGGYTNQSIREAWRKRVNEKLPWDKTGGHADTTEGIERALAIAVRYARQPRELAENVSSNVSLTQCDDTVLSMSVAFCAVLGLLVAGERLDSTISEKLMGMVKRDELPFHAVTQNRLQPPRPGDPVIPRAGRFASPDALLTPSYVAEAAKDPAIRIEPAWKVSIVYGMPCAVYHQLPAAYYLAARYTDDFESAVLHAVNGGGQNQSRAILTGALVGAQTGLSGIPQRFVDGLENSEQVIALVHRLAEQAAA